MQRSYNLKSVPFHAKVVQRNVLQNCFAELKYRLQRLNRKASSRQYYSINLAQKSFEVLKWNKDVRSHKKMALLQFEAKFGVLKKIKEKAFDALVIYAQKRKLNRQRVEKLTFQRSLTLQVLCFSKLVQEMKRNQENKFANEQLLKLYEMNLKKRAYKTLYNHTTFRIIKNNMRQTATEYSIRELQKKSIFAFWQNLNREKMKRQLNKMAAALYKRFLMQRWIGVLNQQQQFQIGYGQHLTPQTLARRQDLSFQTPKQVGLQPEHIYVKFLQRKVVCGLKWYLNHRIVRSEQNLKSLTHLNINLKQKAFYALSSTACKERELR